MNRIHQKKWSLYSASIDGGAAWLADKTENLRTRRPPFEAQLPTGSTASRLTSVPAPFRIVGSGRRKADRQYLRQKTKTNRRPSYRFTSSSGSAELPRLGGPAMISTSKSASRENSELYARIPAGEVTIENRHRQQGR